MLIDGENGTYIHSNLFGFVKCKAVCYDGVARTTSVINPGADTFFSIPATMKIRGKSVRGFVFNDNGTFYFEIDLDSRRDFGEHLYRKEVERLEKKAKKRKEKKAKKKFGKK